MNRFLRSPHFRLALKNIVDRPHTKVAKIVVIAVSPESEQLVKVLEVDKMDVGEIARAAQNALFNYQKKMDTWNRPIRNREAGKLQRLIDAQRFVDSVQQNLG